MGKSAIQVLKFLAFLAAGIVLLWLSFRTINFKNLAEGLKQANYSWLALSVLFGFFAFVSRARRWVLLIHPLGHNPSLWHTFHAMMSGYLANLALPRVGEVTRCVALGRKEKIPVDQLFGTVVVERTIDFLSLLIITLFLILTKSENINQYLRESIWIPLQEKVFSLSGFTWIIWIVVLLAGIISFYFLVRYRKSLRKIHFFAKIFDIARGIINGLKTVTGMQRKWEFLFHTIFIWVNYALMTWVVVFSLESTSHLSFMDSIFILVIGGLAMSAPVQSGIGAFHYFVSRGLAFVEKVKLEDGMVYALLTHESQLIFVAIVGTISFFIMFHKQHNS